MGDVDKMDNPTTVRQWIEANHNLPPSEVFKQLKKVFNITPGDESPQTQKQLTATCKAVALCIIETYLNLPGNYPDIGQDIKGITTDPLERGWIIYEITTDPFEQGRIICGITIDPFEQGQIIRGISADSIERGRIIRGITADPLKRRQIREALQGNNIDPLDLPLP